MLKNLSLNNIRLVLTPPLTAQFFTGYVSDKGTIEKAELGDSSETAMKPVRKETPESDIEPSKFIHAYTHT